MCSRSINKAPLQCINVESYALYEEGMMKNKTPSIVHRSVLNIEQPSAFAAILAALRIFFSLCMSDMSNDYLNRITCH